MSLLRIDNVIALNGNDELVVVVKSFNDRPFHTRCPRPLVQEHEGDRWLPVAVCSVDRPLGRVLIEFPEWNREPVNRLWVSEVDVREGNSHVNLLKDKALFAVIRLNPFAECTAWDQKVRVVSLEKKGELAQNEADRRNRLQEIVHPAIFFWQPVRAPKD